MRVDRCNDVKQSGDYDEAGAVVGRGDLDGICAEAKLAADEIEESAAEITGKAQHIQNILGAGEKLALHGDAEDEHAAYGEKQQGSANPFALHEMPCSGEKPACQERSVLESCGGRGLRGGCRHFFLILHEGAAARPPRESGLKAYFAIGGSFRKSAMCWLRKDSSAGLAPA